MFHVKHFAERLAADEAAGLRRHLSKVESLNRAEKLIDGQQLVCFASSDYLGMAYHPALQRAAAAASNSQGWGSASSRLVAGSLPAHRQLEWALASFAGTEAALYFGSGYAANCGAIPALAQQGDVLFSDERNHASLIDGCRLSKATTLIFRHNDLGHLRELLMRHRRHHRAAWLLTEGIFSMDGDLAPLAELAAVAAEYETDLYVDEAHSIGVLGPGGRGACAAAGVSAAVRMIGFGKALGGVGGAIVADRLTVDFLQGHARTFMFSTAPPPAVAAAGLAALELLEAAEAERQGLQQTILQVRSALRSLGWPIELSPSPIVPLVFGDAQATMQAAACLRQAGIFVQGIRPPTVPEGTSRLRIVLSAAHKDAHIEQFVSALQNLKPPTSKPQIQTGRQPAARWLISGVGTGVGKTSISRGIAMALRHEGCRIVAVKPFETGCTPHALDAQALAQACGFPAVTQLPAWYRATPALSPWAATLQTGCPPADCAAIDRQLTELASQHELLLIEGAGGLLVPLDAKQTIADWAARSPCRLVLVARDQLGVLSSVFTAVEAAERRRLPLAAIVLTASEDQDDTPHSNRTLLATRLAPTPVLRFKLPSEHTDAALAEAARQCGMIALMQSQ